MANPFLSERLLYRAIEDTPEDDTFIHSIQSDTVAYGNSSGGLWKPQSKKITMDGWKKYLLERALLSVIVCLRDDKETPIGVLALKPLGLQGYDPCRESYISIDIAAAHRGRGYGTEVIEWALYWGFEVAGLHRVGIEVFSYNEGALKLYRKMGFVEEARRRECVWFMGQWHDFYTFALIEHEWRQREALKTEKLKEAK